jgi:hypothetical protein
LNAKFLGQGMQPLSWKVVKALRMVQGGSLLMQNAATITVRVL